MKRLLIDGTTLSARMDGLSQYMLNIIKHIDTSRFECTLIVRPNECPTEYQDGFIGDGMKIETVNIAPIGPLRDIQFASYLRDHKGEYDCAFIPSNQYPIALHLPSVYTIHDLIYECYPSQLGKLSWLKRAYLKCVVHIGLKKAKRVIAVSNYTKEEILRIHKHTDAAKIQVIYEGWEHLKETHADVPIQPAFERYILYVGSARGHKNLHRLIEAIAIARESFPENFGVIIAGNTKQLSKASLEAIDQINAKSACIALTGWLTNDELSTYFAHATGFIFPSLCEGFGIPVLEAFYHRVPILLSNCASLPEVGGDAALYFNPHDSQAIAQAITDFIKNCEHYTTTLTARGYQRMNLFSWETAALEVCELLEQATPEHSQSSKRDKKE